MGYRSSSFALGSWTSSALATRETNVACNSPSRLRSPSNRSAQTRAPVSVEISCALTVIVSLTRRTLPFQGVADAEFAPDLLRIDRLTFLKVANSVGRCGVVGDHESAGQMREVRRQIVDEAIGESVLFGVAAQVGERQNGD